ncbi:MAG TPA: hypothetical protein VLE27_12390, partial [Thermoanaerobaculia bacterium]|nr:hypothetical protein [Thermoanaerobaculia bacterium]
VTQSDYDFSSYNEAQFAFESIGASAWKSLSRILESQLVSMRLVTSYFQHQASSFESIKPECEYCQTVFQDYDAIEENSVYSLVEDVRRNTLLAAISLLDSFLSDSLRFLFLHWPHTLPRDVEKQKPGEEYPSYVERIVRRSRRFSSQSSRVGFLVSQFGVSLYDTLLPELSRLTTLRNELVHHVGFYRFVVDPGRGLRSEEKPLPYVTEEDARKIPVIVGDVCDTIYVAMSNGIFGVDPKVRPVNPELAELHRSLREKWATDNAKPPDIEEFPTPNWTAKVLSNPSMPWVGDDWGAWIVIPSGLDILPPSITFRWNNRDGMKALASVDDKPQEEIEASSRTLLGQMLTGRSVVVKYFEIKSDGPKYARFPLDGFAEAWDRACGIKEESRARNSAVLSKDT